MADIKMGVVKVVATGTVGWPPVEEMIRKVCEAEPDFKEIAYDKVLEAYQRVIAEGR
jgi:hypothetical protein